MPRPLIVVSNRLPFRVVRDGRSTSLVRSSGGLVSALEPALRSSGGTWVGWNGAAGEEGAAGAPAVPRDPAIRYVSVPLSAHDVAAYYHDFSNRTLWPLTHYFVGRTEIDAATWRAYERVNDRFAGTRGHSRGRRSRPPPDRRAG